MGTSPGKFLIIDDNVDNRFLLTRTISRKFPAAEIRECGEIDAAISIAGEENIDAVISHRVDLADGIDLVGQLRRINPAVPIIMVSSYDRTREALAAGASRFLPYDEWLRIGVVTEEVLATQPYAAMISAFTFAIERRFTVTFQSSTGDGRARRREVEPHVLGVDVKGQFVMQGYTVTSGTRNPLRDMGWETHLLAPMKNVSVGQRLFAPQHGGAPRDANIVRVLCQIEGTASAFIPRLVSR